MSDWRGCAGGPDLFKHAAAQTGAGRQKRGYNAGTKKWTLVYTLQAGLKSQLATGKEGASCRCKVR